MWAAVKEIAHSEISRLDNHIQELFGKRLDQVGFIGKAKSHLGEEINEPDREEKVLRDWEHRFQKMGFLPGAGTKIGQAVAEVYQDEQRASKERGDYRPKRKFFRT